MSVIARFHIAEVSRFAYNPEARKVVLRAVSRGPENKKWAAATPSGDLTMTVANGPASVFFDDNLGKEVYLRIEVADDPACPVCGEPVQQLDGVQIDAALDGWEHTGYGHKWCLGPSKYRKP